MTRSPFLSKNPHVVRHLSNQIGRDFVVGDLHGCRNLLDAMLEKAEAQNYTVQLVLQTQHWFLISVIDNDDVERFYFSYYERPAEPWEEGDVD